MVRSVPMAPEVAKSLARLAQRDRWTGDDDLVFPGASGYFLDGRALSRRYVAAARRAGLRELRFHDLRHTFGTRMIGKAHIGRVQEWMGHADVQTTMKYLHYVPREQDAELVAEAFHLEPDPTPVRNSCPVACSRAILLRRMSLNGEQAERVAAKELPDLLAELLELEGGVSLHPQRRGADLVIDLPEGRRLVAEVKSSARSADVAAAARQARAYAQEGDLPVVVVPYMGEAGARAAAAEGVGWIDLSGNARLRDRDLFVRVEGRANRYPSRGRPSSPFAPASSRVTRHLLQDPERWWRQAELSKTTGLDDGRVSKLVARLDELELLERDGPLLRPRDPDALLDAWAADYNFAAHDIVACHLTAPGGGVELAREIADGLAEASATHALTGLPAAWMLDKFAQFRLVSVFVDDDPRRVADLIGARVEPRGANLQLIGPNDGGVFVGADTVDGVRVVAPVQAYLDLLALPERAREAAEHLREKRLSWRRRG